MITISNKTIQSPDGIDLYYEISRTDSTGPFLFLIHGVGGDLDAWQYIRQGLHADGFSTIAMDIRGHGKSGHPHRMKSYSVEHFVDDFLTILREENLDKVVLIGHSLGAVLAIHIALRHPEKIHTLIVLSGSCRPPFYLKIPVIRSISIAIINTLAVVSPRAFHPRHSTYPPDKFHKEYEFSGLVRTIAHNSLMSYLLSSKEILKTDLGPQIHTIQIPTLIVSGDKDTIFPTPISEYIHSQIKGSELKIIKNANHVIVLNNIKETTEAIKTFLTRSLPTSD